jgi:3-hydroxybutyryl-CoA dehydrogenase
VRNTGFVRIDTVGVVGLGTMGAGIAEVFGRAGLDVVAVEINDDLVAAGRRRLEASLKRAVDRGRLEASERDAILGRTTFTADRAALAAAQLVVEAVPERLEAKVGLFDELDGICPPTTILATNTSSLPVTRIAAATGRPGRVIGMHFFNPAPVMRLVEVVHTVLSDDDVVDGVRDLAERCGKTPVVVGDRAGFVANALLFGYLNHAAYMAETRHAAIADIDAAMTAGCGLPMGPLALMDLIGLDVCLEVLEVMYDETRDQRYAAAPLLRRLVMAGQLGRKTGRGYYAYDGDTPRPVAVTPDERVESQGGDISVALTGVDHADLATQMQAAGLTVVAAVERADLVVNAPAAPRAGTVVELAARSPRGRGGVAGCRRALEAADRVVVVCKARPGYVLEALLFPHLNDAARMVDEGYATVDDVDAAMRLGCGYPDGPFAMLSTVGPATVARGLGPIAASRLSAAVAASPLLDELGRA